MTTRHLRGAPRRIESWFCANTAERNAIEATLDDRGRIAYQADDNTYWRLTGVLPKTWLQVGTGTGESGEGGGGSDKYYHHNQSIAASTWVISHALAKNPSVTIIIDGSLSYAEIAYNDTNTLSITFAYAVIGDAYLN